TVLSGAPTNAGNYYVVAAFTSSDSNYDNATSAKTGFTITQAPATFSNLSSSATITFGTLTTTLSGHLAAGTLLPAKGETITITSTLLGNGLAPSGRVAVTINGKTHYATIQHDGTFSVAFPTAALPAGTYSISFTFAGNGNFTTATGSSTLTVQKEVPTFST